MSAARIIDEIRKFCALTINDPGIDSRQLGKRRAYHVVSTQESKYFLKTAPAQQPDVCMAEAIALQSISKHTPIKTPKVICQGTNNIYSFLLLEYLRLNNTVHQQRIAELVTDLHTIEGIYYGWHQTNYIGPSVQYNKKSNNWSEFWLTQRLMPQHHMAKDNGVSARLLKQSTRLQQISEELLKNHQPKPVLLHGDFWYGNVATLTDGTAVTFDPAIYYGDRETDIAMTELFGGFDDSFYAAYQSSNPLPPQYQLRKHLYNSYHLLNHVNSFGEQAYGRAFSQIVNQLSAQM